MTWLVAASLVCDVAAVCCALVAGSVFHELGDPIGAQLRRRNRSVRSLDLRFWGIGVGFLVLSLGCAVASHAVWWA